MRAPSYTSSQTDTHTRVIFFLMHTTTSTKPTAICACRQPSVSHTWTYQSLRGGGGGGQCGVHVILE
ncbi:hypothetical protein T492DRAFT_514543 [Pavlovales sp. CCMP2436]|nr:hypothetical protein T492DRAFT_514543 [Pavlovales sp. CCMP2436]